MRQDYRNAVTVGRRSGSGKLVEDNWDILKSIWGGSPTVINLRNSLCSLQNELSDKEDNESGNMNGENVSGDKSQRLYINIEEPIAKNPSGGLAPTAKFVDNKCKLLGKKSIGKPKRSNLWKSCQKGLGIKAGPATWTRRSNKGIQQSPE